MQYRVTTQCPFEALEAQAIGALERQGFLVSRTFSLRSAARPEWQAGGGGPGYTVLMLYRSGEGRQPLALVTLYEWQGRIVIEARATPPLGDVQALPSDMTDIEAELAASLSQGGLEFCVRAAGGQGCVTPEPMEDDGLSALHDPVPGGDSNRQSEECRTGQHETMEK